MIPAPEIDCESFDINDSGDIIGLARTLVDGRHPGILATVNQQGRPEIRWMSTLAFDEFPVFYTLTRPNSRKVDQIRAHPAVNWMFFNKERTLILNLLGNARVLTDTTTLKRVWSQVENKSLTYFLDQYAKPPGFVVIETTVDAIECAAPDSALRFAIDPAELKEVRY